MAMREAAAKLRAANERITRIAAEWQARGIDTSALAQPLVDLQDGIAEVEASIPHDPRPTTVQGRRHLTNCLLRLDLDLIRRNLEDAAEAPQTEDDVLRLLAGLGLWRHSDEWWGADDAAVRNFREGEIIERREGA